MDRPPMPAAGFTLVELLVTIAILAVLVALLIPAVGLGISQSRQMRCSSNLRQIGSAVMGFAADNEGHGPGGGQETAPTSHSVAWDDILNREVWGGQTLVSLNGGAQSSAGSRYLTCPSYRNASGQYGRCYTYNSYAAGGTANAAGVHPYGPDIIPASQRGSAYTEYHLGAPLERFANPSGKLLVIETERTTDYFGIQFPAGQMTMGSGGYAPHTANGGVWAFRHGGKMRMNLLFVDCHVAASVVDPQLNTGRFIDLDTL